MPCYEKYIQRGNVLDVRKYHAVGRRTMQHRQRGERVASSTAIQAEKNEWQARRRLYWLICTNFKPYEDVFLTLTHGDATDEEKARIEIKKFFEKVRYHCQKQGFPEVRYILVIEKQGRWHHHLVMNYLPCKMIISLWTCGQIKHYEHLRGEETFMELVGYLLNDDKLSKEPRPKNKRRWSSSKNLEQPTVVVHEIGREEILLTVPSVPDGYRLLPDWYNGCDAYGHPYQVYTCIRNETAIKINLEEENG